MCFSVSARLCACVSLYSIVCVCVRVCVCVCGPALHCAGGQNTRDCFDLDSLCLVQSQSCHQVPTAGATHSWCREETLLHVIILYTLHFTRTMLTKWLHPYPYGRLSIVMDKRIFIVTGRIRSHLESTCNSHFVGRDNKATKVSEKFRCLWVEWSQSL